MGKIVDIGSLGSDSWEDLKMLNSFGISDKYTTFQYPVGTYHQVAPGKLLKCGLITYTVDKIGARIDIGYGDDAVNNSAVAPTNYVELMHGVKCEAVNGCACEKIFIVIPSGKYPVAFFSDNSGVIRLYGFEET